MAAVSLGKGGPGIANIQFAIDSSGAARPPQPPVAAPPALLPPRVQIRGRRVTVLRRPLFLLALDPRARSRLQRSGARFVCRIGRRGATLTRPCGRRFRAPDIGPGRHVLVVRIVTAAGNASRWVKLPYYVRKRAYRHR